MKAVIVGAKGKMGSLVTELMKASKRFDTVYEVDQKGSEFHSLDEVPKADVLIDFSHPSMLASILAYGKRHHTPLVIATTGYSEEEEKSIIEASKTLPIFKSSNYSFGVEVITHILRQISNVLIPEFDVEIIEKHHRQKIDAPSGTSRHLARTIIQSAEFPLKETHGHQGKRKDDDLSIHAIRGGSIVGDHTIIFAGQNETIEITHTAQSRTIFAQGALRAAEWILSKQDGLYQMKDLLKERLS